MGGLVKFLLGGVLGAILGFVLSRSRAGTPVRRSVYPIGDQFPAPKAAPVSTVPATAETDWAPSEVVETPEEASVGAAAEKPCAPPVAAAEWPLAVPPVGEGAGRPLISAEDLRVRIEESRRRIRQELEEPFVMPDRVTEVPAPPVVAPSVVTDAPVVVPPRVPEPPAVSSPSEWEASSASPVLAPEPLVSLIPSEAIDGPDVAAEAWETPSPSIEIQPVDESLFAELGVRVDRTPGPTGESEDLRSRIESARQASEGVFRPSPEELETSLSYDAMRARIEETRDRLKAKAMDARMPGDASDTDGIPGATSLRSSADTEAEIAARIDSILSEKNE